MITKQALRASAKARKAGAANCGYVALLKAGEQAYLAGKPLSANPHTGEDAAIWAEGWTDAKENL